MKLRDENGKIYFGWYVVLLAAVVGAFMYNGIISTAGLFLIPVTTDLGIGVSAFSMCVSIISLINIIVIFFLSQRLNKNNIKKIMIVCGILGIIGFVGISFSTKIWHFYLWSVLLGVCFGACTATPCAILVNNWFGIKARGRAMSFYMSGLSVISIVMMNILNQIILNGGWQAGYMTLAGGVLVCVLLMIKCIAWSPEEKGIARMGDDEETIEMEKAAAAVDAANLPGYTVQEGMRKPVVWAVFLSCIFLVLASSGILQHGIPTVVMAGYSQTMATLISSAMTICLILANVVVGWIVDKAGVKAGTILTSMFFFLALFTYAFLADMPALVYPMVFLYSFGVPAVNLISPLMITRVCGEKEAHKFISYVNMFIGIGGIFGALIVGALFDMTGAYKIPWLVMAAMLFVSLVLRAVSMSEKNKFKTEGGEM